MGNTDEQIDQRSRFNIDIKREMIAALQTLFDQHFQWIQTFAVSDATRPEIWFFQKRHLLTCGSLAEVYDVGGAYFD